MSLIHKTQKSIIFSLLLVLLFFGLNFVYNNSEGASAQTEKPISCDIVIPIGETTDKAEDVGQKTIEQLSAIISAIGEQIKAAEKMATLSKECKLDSCAPGLCEDTSRDAPELCLWPGHLGKCAVCRRDATLDTITGMCRIPECKIQKCSCSGDQCACPQDIYSYYAEVVKQNENMGSAFNSISKILSQQKSSILNNLKKSRDGIAGCVIRTEDLLARAQGEREGKILYSCKAALRDNLIEPVGESLPEFLRNLLPEQCYGQTKCEAERALGKEPPKDWLCPRMENYYCCY